MVDEAVGSRFLGGKDSVVFLSIPYLLEGPTRREAKCINDVIAQPHHRPSDLFGIRRGV